MKKYLLMSLLLFPQDVVLAAGCSTFCPGQTQCSCGDPADGCCNSPCTCDATVVPSEGYVRCTNSQAIHQFKPPYSPAIKKLNINDTYDSLNQCPPSHIDIVTPAPKGFSNITDLDPGTFFRCEDDQTPMLVDHPSHTYQCPTSLLPIEEPHREDLHKLD